jgi:hypothetical protein
MGEDCTIFLSHIQLTMLTHHQLELFVKPFSES